MQIFVFGNRNRSKNHISLKNNKIKILAVIPTPPPYSGPEICGELFLSFKLGPEFEIYHLSNRVNIKNIDKGKLSISSISNMFRVLLHLIWLAWKHKPHILYTYLSQNLTGFIRDALIISTGRLFGMNVIAQVHGSNFKTFLNNSSPYMKIIIKFIMSRLARIIVLADRFRSQFQGIMPEEYIKVIPNAVDSKPFYNETIKITKGETLNILFVGHLSQAKGFLDILKSIPQVLISNPNVKFYFAGEWLDEEKNILYDENGKRLYSDIDEVKSLWREMNKQYGDRIHYLGVMTGDNKIQAFNNADIFILPSYSEGFPMVVLEAMAAGLPLIVTAVGALPEVLEHNVNAIFVPTGDPSAISSAILNLLINPAKRKQMGKINRLLVGQKYSPNVVALKLANIFQSATP
jgi:glycosyltransferase involved in cell wall biosynthesis